MLQKPLFIGFLVNPAIATVLMARMSAGLQMPPLTDWLLTLEILILYGAIALPIGFASGLLCWQPWSASWLDRGLATLRILVFPGLFEEWLFRVLLLPVPASGSESLWWGWAGFGLVLYVLFHPLNAKFVFKAAAATFFDPTFLTLTTLLGIACTIDYRLTASLWTIAFIHWVAVVIWLLCLGGMQRLGNREAPNSAQI